MSEQTFTEAPASATLRIEYKGYDVLFTLRDTTGADLLKKLEGAIIHFEKMGIKPASQNNGNKPAAANGSAPTCPTHNKPMKPGKTAGGIARLSYWKMTGPASRYTANRKHSNL